MVKGPIVILHNVRSAHNVGAIFRTADAAGVSHIYLTGYTPAPLDSFKRPQKEIAKTALGAETYIPWSSCRDLSPVIRKLTKSGVQVVAVEQDARALDYRTLQHGAESAFIFGNEVRGLSRSARDMCDVIVHIPMRGKKESLNVATTAGIILFSALN